MSAIAASFESLRNAIVQPRAGDGAEPIETARPWSLRRELAELLPHRSDSSVSIFDEPLTRQVSGWGGVVGLLLGLVAGWGHGLWTLGGGLISAVTGSLAAVCALVMLAVSVATWGVIWTLVLAVLFVVLAAWIGTPWS